MRHVLIAFLLALSGKAFSYTPGFYTYPALTSATAGVEHWSSTSGDTYAAKRAFEMSYATSMSCQIVWASLTGTLDAVVTLESSNDASNWEVKTVQGSTAEATLDSADGSEIINLNGVASENYYRVHYDPNNVTGGTVTVKCIGK